MNQERSWTEAEFRTALDQYEGELRQSGKSRNTISTYVQHPERFINWLVGRYSPGPLQARSTDMPTTTTSTSRSSKYDPLRDHLRHRTELVVRMTFSEIETILGATLPRSAREHRAWWSNNDSESHVQAQAWRGGGRRTTKVDFNAGVVEFTR